MSEQQKAMGTVLLCVVVFFSWCLLACDGDDAARVNVNRRDEVVNCVPKGGDLMPRWKCEE